MNETPAASLPTIVVIATGGTIASRMDSTTGAVRALASARELLDSIPEIAALANVELVHWAAVNSWNMTPPMMLDLAQQAACELARPNVAGVVVTHGTDTVEESALVAELTVASAKPIVFTVAMRSMSELGADGPRNLHDAVRVTIDPLSANRGAMLVVNETIHAARYATKMNTLNPQAFESPDFGPIGMVTADAVRYLHDSRPRTILDVPHLEDQVHIVKAVSGQDERIIDWLLETGMQGLVIEGSGAGNVPGSMLSGIHKTISQGVPVMLTSRCPHGFLAAAYGTGGAAGGGHDLARIGVIPANHLPSQKARIALMLALGGGVERESLGHFFATV